MARILVHFWHGTGFIGTAIRWFTWGPVSHVAMQIDNTLFEAREFRGVVQNPAFSEFAKRPPSATLELEVSPEKAELARYWWHVRIGLPYDYLSVFRFITRQPETAGTKPRYFCSEAVHDCCKYIGMPLFKRVDGSRVAPSWIYRSPVLKESEKSCDQQS